MAEYIDEKHFISYLRTWARVRRWQAANYERQQHASSFRRALAFEIASTLRDLADAEDFEANLRESWL